MVIETRVLFCLFCSFFYFVLLFFLHANPLLHHPYDTETVSSMIKMFRQKLLEIHWIDVYTRTYVWKLEMLVRIFLSLYVLPNPIQACFKTEKRNNIISYQSWKTQRGKQCRSSFRWMMALFMCLLKIY